MTDRFLRIDDVVRKVGFSRTTIWRMRRDDGFPEPARIRGRFVAWSEAEVSDWMKEQLETRQHLVRVAENPAAAFGKQPHP